MSVGHNDVLAFSSVPSERCRKFVLRKPHFSILPINSVTQLRPVDVLHLESVVR